MSSYRRPLVRAVAAMTMTAAIPAALLAQAAKAPPATVGTVEVRGDVQTSAAAETPSRSAFSGRSSSEVEGRLRSPATSREGLDERRRQDYLSAPYAAPAGAPRGAGRVVAIDQTVATAEGLGRRFLLGDEVRIELPTGVAPVPGTRFVAIRREATLPGGVAVIRPTGVVELREFEGALVRGRVVQLLGAMEGGQGLLPMPVAGPVTTGGTTGAAARVIWAADGALLPSLQDWVLLAPAAGAALTEGDRLELTHPIVDESGATLGEEVVATARVVRVTTGGASAILTSVRKPLVAVGTMARVVAGEE